MAIILDTNQGHFYYSDKQYFALGDKYDISVQVAFISPQLIWLSSIIGPLTSQFMTELDNAIIEHGIKMAVAWFPTGWVPRGWTPLMNTDAHYRSY